jgi:hypothetical protein
MKATVLAESYTLQLPTDMSQVGVTLFFPFRPVFYNFAFPGFSFYTNILEKEDSS